MKQRVGIILMLGFFVWSPLALGSERVVERASGSGNKVVGPFAVEDRWEVRWDFDGYALQIFVNQKDAPYPDLPIDDATQEGAGRGSFRQDKSGTYYLKVVAQGSWAIEVIDLP